MPVVELCEEPNSQISFLHIKVNSTCTFNLFQGLKYGNFLGDKGMYHALMIYVLWFAGIIERMVIIGNNGAWKSRLARMMKLVK